MGRPTYGREESPKLYQIGAIHLQEFNGHAPFRCSADGATANDLKMRGPVVIPWIDESLLWLVSRPSYTFIR
ncbi:MAG: hypothetical protein NT013_00045 [Planctomycetia bacterium]|nr:hypothetical protein [Planctomycetia bacterium]